MNSVSVNALRADVSVSTLTAFTKMKEMPCESKGVENHSDFLEKY